MREEGTRRSKVNLGRGLIGLNAHTLCHPTCDDSERRCGEDGVRSVPGSFLGSPRLLFGPSGTRETARAEGWKRIPGRIVGELDVCRIWEDKPEISDKDLRSANRRGKKGIALKRQTQKKA